MLATSSQFTAMVEGITHDYVWRVEIDLPGGIYPDVTVAASAIEIDASITTDLAEGTRLEEGYSSQQATFTLSGSVSKTDPSQDAAWLFGRYSTTSPLYRADVFMCPVRVYLGLYPAGANGVPEMLRKFTGFVEDYTQDADGNVSFTCLDGRQMLRSAASVPNVVTAPPFNAGLTSEFPIDALLRAATNQNVSSWPAQRTGCVLAVGFRSSLWAELGTLDTTVSQPIGSFAPQAWGSGLVGYTTANTASDQITYRLASTIGGPGGCTIQMIVQGADVGTVTVTLGGDLAVTGGRQRPNPALTLTVSPAGFALAYGTGSGSLPYTFTPGTHVVTFAAVVVTSTGPARAQWGGYVYVDGVNVGTLIGGFVGAASSAATTCSITNLSGGATIAGLQVTSEDTTAAVTPWTPGAVMDPSLNPLQVIPELAGDPWQSIQQAALAELAIARFDESTGQFRYTNRNTIAAAPISRTISALASLETIGGVESTAASVVNRAQIGYTGWSFATTATTIYSLDTVMRVPRFSTVPITVTLDSAAVNVDTTIARLPNGTVDPTQSWVRASSDPAGLNGHPGPISYRVTQPTPTTLTITVFNRSSADAWLVSSSDYTDIPVGTPVLQIAGFVVTQQNEVTADYQWPTTAMGGAVSSRFGEVLFTSTGDPWSQTASPANALTEVIVEDSYQPRPNFTGLEIVPDPRLQIGDKAFIDDTAHTGVVEYVRIFGYTITWTAGAESDDYSMTIDGRTLASPGQTLLGVPGRSELATTSYL